MRTAGRPRPHNPTRQQGRFAVTRGRVHQDELGLKIVQTSHQSGPRHPLPADSRSLQLGFQEYVEIGTYYLHDGPTRGSPVHH
jgi:hypothetical protein